MSLQQQHPRPVTKNNHQQQPPLPPHSPRVKSNSSTQQQQHDQLNPEQEDQYLPSHHQNTHQHHKSQHRLAPVPSVCVRVPHSPRASVDSGASFGTIRAGASPPTTPSPPRHFKTLAIDMAASTTARECEPATPQTPKRSQARVQLPRHICPPTQKSELQSSWNCPRSFVLCPVPALCT